MQALADVLRRRVAPLRQQLCTDMFRVLLCLTLALATDAQSAESVFNAAGTVPSALGRSDTSLSASSSGWVSSSIATDLSLSISAATVAVAGSQNAPYRAADAWNPGLDPGPRLGSTATEVKAVMP